MKTVYRIEETNLLQTPKTLVSAFYPKMDLEGIFYILSHLFEVRILVFARKETLKTQITDLCLTQNTLGQSLDKIVRFLENLSKKLWWRQNGTKILITEHAQILDSCFDHLPWFDLWKTQDQPDFETTLAHALFYVAQSWKYSMIVKTDSFFLEKRFKINLTPMESMASFIRKLQTKIWGLEAKCFEDFLQIQRVKPNLTIH